MQTHFNSTPIKSRTTRGQIALYAFAGLFSLWLAVQGGSSAWAHRHDASQPADPNTFRGGLDTIFGTWKREVWDQPRPQATPAPTAQRTQAAPVSTTQVPAATATATETPYQATDAQMAEWRHVPPGQEANYEAYRQRVAAQQPTPAPTPYLMPEVVAATPDPVAARYGAWKTMRDAYAKQQLVRAQNAKSDAEKGQIQREIALWRQNNPEPPKPATSQNPDEIPIR